MIRFKKREILEEVFNSILHGFGLILSITGLLYFLLHKGSPENKIISLSIFGVALILMYLISTLYHSLIFTKAKKVFHVLDYAAIFLLIAGTYTPFITVGLKGIASWLFLVLIWSMAIIGIVLKATVFKHHSRFFVFLYLIMGWLSLLAIIPLWHSVTHITFFLILLGGLWYTVGTIFYRRKSMPYAHTIWHIFVMLGTISHYFAAVYL